MLWHASGSTLDLLRENVTRKHNRNTYQLPDVLDALKSCCHYVDAEESKS